MSQTTIKIVVDNDAANKNLAAEHGWALVIDSPDSLIVFDTGASKIFSANAHALAIDLTQTTHIALSHGHYDHTGDLINLFDKAPHAQLYLHPHAMQTRYSCPKDKPPKSIGIPPLTADLIRQKDQQNQVSWTTSPTQVKGPFWLTGQIPRNTDFEDTGGPFFLDTQGQKPDDILDDQALFFQTKKGIVIILGCAHSGVVNTMRYISQITGQKNFFMVLGGTHLRSAGPERIRKTIDALRLFNVKHIAPTHCTGQKAQETLQQAFPNRYLHCPAGNQITLDL